MMHARKPARINVKVLVILVLVVVLLGVGAVTGHYVRKRMMAADALAAGKVALENEEWTEASTHLRLYLSKYPDDEAMLEQYAKARMAIDPIEGGNVAAALGAYRRLLRLRPGDAVVCKQLAKLYFEVARDFVECAYVCNQRLELAPTDRAALFYLARSLQAQQKNGEAYKQLEKLVAAHPGDVRSFAMLAGLSLKTGGSDAADKAIGWLNRAIDANAQSGEALVHRGVFLFRESKNAIAARKDFETAAALGLSDPRVILTLAGEWLNLGELDRARQVLSQTDDVSSDTLDAFDVMPDQFFFGRLLLSGRISLAGGNTEHCATVADEAMASLSGRNRTRFLPVATDLYLASGRVSDARRVADLYRAEVGNATGALADQVAITDAAVATAEGKSHTVIRLLSELVRANPNMQTALRFLWRAFEKTGQTRQARTVLEAYVDLQTTAGTTLDPEALLSLAQAMRKDDWAATWRYASLVERLRPDDLGAKLLRMEAVLRGGAGRLPSSRLNELSQELAELQTKYPARAGIRLIRALLTARTDVEQAVADIERAIEECDDSMALSIEVSRHYFRKGDPEKAVTVLRAAKERTPSSATPRLVLARMLVSMDRQSEARQTLVDAVEELIGDDRYSVSLALARFMLTANKRVTAVGMLKQLAGERPEDVTIRRILLSLSEVRADAGVAQKLVDEIKGIEGESGVRWRLEQVKLFLSSDAWMAHHSDIETDLQVLRQSDPTWTEPVILLADLNRRLGNNVRAEELYRRALSVDPGNSVVASRLLSLLESQRRFADAAEILQRMPSGTIGMEDHQIDVALGRGDITSAMSALEIRVENDTDAAPARVVLARLVYLREKDVGKAMRLLDEAKVAAPNLISIPIARADIFRSDGHEDKALALIDAEVQRRNDFAAYRMRASLHESTHAFDLAEKDYTHLTTIDGQEAAGFLELGRFLFVRGRIVEAISAWETGLERSPGNPALRRSLVKGLVLSKMPDLVKRGTVLLDDLLRQFPDDAELLAVRATELLNASKDAQSDVAVAALERVVQLNPRNVLAHLRLITLASGRGDRARAMELTIRALGANGKNHQLTLIRAGLEAQIGNVGIARQLADSILQANPQNTAAGVIMSELSFRAGNLDEALKYAQEALFHHPESEAAQIIRAMLLSAKQNGAEAVTHLEAFRRTETGGKSLGVLLSLSQLYREQGNLNTASERLAAAKELAPHDVRVFVENIRSLAARNRHDEIVSEAARRHVSHPKEVRSQLAAGLVLVSTGQEKYLRESKALFEALVILDPSLIRAKVGLAQSAYHLREFEIAEASYRSVLGVEPYNLQAINDLAWILGVETGRVDEAIALAERGANRYPHDPHLLDTYGELLALAGRLPEARASLEKCITSPQGNPRTHAFALFHLGRVYSRQGVHDLARASLLEAQRMDRVNEVFTDKDRSAIDQLLEQVTP